METIKRIVGKITAKIFIQMKTNCKMYIYIVLIVCFALVDELF